MRLPIYLKISILCLFVNLTAFSQATLRGSVADSSNNELLVGASVSLQGTSLGIATDIEGKFRINAIPERVFTVRVTYIGYEPKLIEVDFSKSKDTQIDIKLKPTVIKGEEVVVIGQMKGQLAAINQQITSKSIVNIVSEEKIQELPDANAAEAIGRLPGVSIIRSGGEATNIVMRGLSSKFSNITVDGVKVPPTDANTRDVDLSMMSQGALAGIELYKTLMPDQDADAIAGTVNLVTRSAPSERLLRFDLKGDYNTLMKSAKQYDLSGRYGQRFFHDILGVQLQASAERKIRSREQTTTGYATSKKNEPADSPYDDDYLISQFTVDFTDEIRNRNGGQVIIDVNTPDNGTIKLTGLYNKTDKYISTYNRVYPYSTGTCDYNLQYQEFGISTVNSSLQGKNHLKGFDLDWNMSYAHSSGTNPYDFLITFMESPGMVGTQPTKNNPEKYIIPYAQNIFSAAQCSTSVFQKQENFDKEITAYLNLSKKYTFNNKLSGELKGGGKYKNQSRWMDQREFDDNNQLHTLYSEGVDADAITNSRFRNYWYNHNTTLLLSDFVDEPAATRDLLNKYKMTPIINMSDLQEWYSLMKNAHHGTNYEFNSSAAAQINSYTTSEKISSAFIMNTLEIGSSISFMSGLRIENEKNDYGGHYSTNLSMIGLIANGTVQDTISHFSETTLLPNVQLVLQPTNYLTIRLAGYRALARPDYNLRLPTFSKVNNGGSAQYILGNTNLKNTKAWNYEINTQIYSNKLGLVSFSAFYKKLDDLYHQMSNVRVSRGNDSLLNVLGLTWQNTGDFKTILDNNTNAQFTLAYNSPGPSYTWGIEIEHQMNFGFLPVPWLRNITLSYNFSVTRSETQIIISNSYTPYIYLNTAGPSLPPVWAWAAGTPYNLAKQVTRRSENQPELYGNISLGYDIGRFSARVSVFYQGEYVQSYSTDGTSDVRKNSFTKWDIALKEQISSKITLFLNIENLTNVVETTSRINTIMNWNLDRTKQLYGMTGNFGIRLSL